ncbi:hypothetical protein [Iningainema tapete]|uniref:Uncharacterized protein n=1 Tax=Iningainema tapete BLCC-T55 TaxID=2748662 RepID=A0A8J6XET9_9CYAN|nr:hypothetical protein [Iningainema tapete]MBD2771297.1 hypothetical protein [Iningainema tapete BLCC-T55]
MRQLTISDIGILLNSKTLASPANYDQKNLQLVIKQIFLELPVKPLLEAHPQINQWVEQVRAQVPEIFTLKKDKLLIDAHFSAALQLNEDNAVIEINTNVAFEKKSVKLIEWAIRQPRLNWYDKVKLWVTSEYLMIPPEQLQLTILALHSKQAAKKHEIYWNQKQHEETQQWLVSVLTEQPFRQKRKRSTVLVSPISSQTLTLPLEEIEEVEI